MRFFYGLCYIVGSSAMTLPRISLRPTLYAFCGLFIILSLFTIFGDRGIFHLRRLRGEKEALDERNFILLRENEALRERIRRLRHDDFYLEKIAREELGLARPGEIVYSFADDESKRKGRSVNASPPEPHPSSEQKSR
jgi:cell division protein FtsB